LLIASSDLPRDRIVIFELLRDIEIVLISLVAAGHEDDLRDTRLERFIDGMLDKRHVNDREHFPGIDLVAGSKRLPVGDGTRPCVAASPSFGDRR
jgi:hypothetical protein